MSYPSSWQPPGQGQRDPRQPFNQAAQPSVRVEQFAPQPQPRWGWIVALVVVLIAAIVIIPMQFRTPSPTPTRTPQPQASTPATPAVAVNGIPFESGGATGFWQIDKAEWAADAVTVHMTIRVDAGTLSYSFFSFDNTASSVYDPDYSAPGSLRPGLVAAGSSASGTVRFDVKPGPITVILATSAGRQITALLIKP